MSKAETILEELATPICEKYACFLYDTEFKKEGSEWYLRLFIDSEGEGGVSLDQCESVNRELSNALDEVNVADTGYILEVSSPGIERLLKRDWHFQKAIGQDVEVKLFKAVDGSKVIIGKLLRADGGIILLELKNGEKMTIEKGKTSQVRISFNFN